MTCRTWKVTTVLVAFMSVLLGSDMASADSIINSKHDFSANNTSGSTNFANEFYTLENGFPLYINEICVFCHTPHNGSMDSETGKLLWNRKNTDTTTYSFVMYSSSTFTAGLGVTQPTGVSLMCMSCHDGVTSLAVNTLYNAPGSGNPQVFVDPSQAPGAIGNAYNGGPPLYWGANLGELTPFSAGPKNINLTNDHPISFEWTYSKPDLYNGPQNPSLRLFGASGKRLECATCHRVHDPGIPPFLAMDNAQSAMCLACHNK